MKRIPIFIFIIALSFSTLACARSAAPQQASPQGGTPPPPVEKTLSTFNPIPGTDYLMAGIVPATVARDSSLNPFAWISSSGYSTYSSYNIYNYVFFNTVTGEYHRLLPANNFVILQTAGYPQPVYDPSEPNKPAPPIEFWVYNMVKTDFNGDGYFDYRDKITVAFSDVSGNGYTELIENVDVILSEYYKDASTFLVIYNVNQKNFVAKINPVTREILSTTEMDLGEDVK